MIAFSLGLSALAILISLLAVYYAWRQAHYAKRQTEIMETQETRRRQEERNTAEWVEKFDKAVAAVLKVGPSFIDRGGGTSTNAYGVALPNPEMRQHVETYLVERKGEHFAARLTNGELLRMPIVQRTIQEVLDCTQKFKENDPDNANRLGL